MRTLLFSVVLIVSISAFGQVNHVATARLSALTKRYLYQLKNSRDKAIPGYVYSKKPGGKVYVSAMIKVSDAIAAQSGLAGIGALVGTKAGKVWTIKVPVEQVVPFTRLGGISYIQLDGPVAPLHAERKTTSTD